MSRIARIRILGGRVIDPSCRLDEVADVVVEDGRVVGMARETGAADGEAVYDAAGLIVAPGFVDLHCHLREPGLEDSETVATGTAAAAAGGFTSVCAMPDTAPTPDSGATVGALLRLIGRDAIVRVHPLGALTRGQQGSELAEMADMVAAGAVAFSDEPRHVARADVMRRALEYSVLTARPVSEHAEDAGLAAGGLMHEGTVATRLGLKGVPREAEEVALARDLALARLSGGWLHVTHLSTARGVELVRRARREGVRITAEVSAHHLTLGEDLLAGGEGRSMYDSNALVRPPLRTDEDREALLEGLCDHTIDCVVTDHSPVRAVDKMCELDVATPGISGLETAFGLLMRLVAAGRMTLSNLIAVLSTRPSAAWDLPYGTLASASPADVVVLDPTARWIVDPERFRSKGRNTPLAGESLMGRVLLTLVGGQVVYHHPDLGLHATAAQLRSKGSSSNLAGAFAGVARA